MSKCATMKRALESIAANTCCGTCREAALVAQKALREVAPANAAQQAKGATCAKCGCPLNEGEARVFTVCDDCW
jgi:hypothetical protein